MEQYTINKPGYGSFQIVLEPDEEDGGYVVECLDLKGCISEGDTRRDALANIADAIDGICESMLAHHGRIILAIDNLSSTYAEEVGSPYSTTTAAA